MVTFITLFLGLITHIHPVEVAVTGPVAAVEMQLDGETVGKVETAPWRVDTDFGVSLLPHELVARAVDSSGSEVARARQWINLPRSRAEAEMVLEKEGDRQIVRVIWESLGDKRPRSIAVLFDDKPLPSVDVDRFVLPAFDLSTIHVLTAEVIFDDALVALTEIPVGGIYGAEITTEMTAVPLVKKRARQSIAAGDLAGSLVKKGEPLSVLATDEGPGDLIVVIDDSAHLGLSHLAGQLSSASGEELEDGETLRFLGTRAARLADREIPFDLFPISPAYRRGDGGLHFLITRTRIPGDAETTRIADAVAAAAIQAASGNRPRAIVLIIGIDSRDTSRFEIAEVQEFLASLRVPLVVWTPGRVQARRVSEDRRPLTLKTDWGTAREISSLARFDRAIDDLERLLDTQMIAWVEGSHLPQEVALAETAKNLELAR